MLSLPLSEYGISNSKISGPMMTSIAIFNIILAFVFGYFHESGVVPVIWKLNTQHHQIIDAVKSSKATFSGLKNDTLTVFLDSLQNLNLDIADITQEYKLNTVVWFVYTLIPPLHLVDTTLVVIPSIYNITEFIPQADSGNGKYDLNSKPNLEFIPIFSIHNHIEFDSLDMYFKSLFKSRDLNCYLLAEKI
ncbi:hypothetical protein AYI70_g5828 [Smittium culicis]|uniref:Uncharacterized protein n=1 Tax=Smittium culicis TaxID=133412 RepID=A0A1R1WY28_9FUNG|nr:hypothetical protein AYI70_g12301 [Smittium culicis]OMJ17664.1 hypothetical protein AYI70_g5828 [Smittium culicis]